MIEFSVYFSFLYILKRKKVEIKIFFYKISCNISKIKHLFFDARGLLQKKDQLHVALQHICYLHKTICVSALKDMLINIRSIFEVLCKLTLC